MIEISPAQRRELRASAHHHNPVVSIASNGLTPAVMQEIERSLQAHELIKIKVHGVERNEREILLHEVCNALDAAPVQHIGTILVVWRQRRDDEKSGAPAAAPRLTGDQRPSKAKSARVFAANARRSVLMREAAERKRKTPRSAKPGGSGRNR